MAQFSENALTVLKERYLLRDEGGSVVEGPTEMLSRVAQAVAAPAHDFGEDRAYWEERFFQRLDALEFLPNSPALMNAGVTGGQLAACFVLPLGDDLESIFGALALAARIQQSGGGTGFSFSELRPAGDLVRSQFRATLVYRAVRPHDDGYPFRWPAAWRKHGGASGRSPGHPRVHQCEAQSKRA